MSLFLIYDRSKSFLQDLIKSSQCNFAMGFRYGISNIMFPGLETGLLIWTNNNVSQKYPVGTSQKYNDPVSFLCVFFTLYSLCTKSRHLSYFVNYHYLLFNSCNCKQAQPLKHNRVRVPPKRKAETNKRSLIEKRYPFQCD